VVTRQPSFVVVSAVSLVLATGAGLGVSALWSSRAASVPTSSATTPSHNAAAPSPAIALALDKTRAAPSERIDLTGNAGGPGIALVVQERSNGSWVDFPAHGRTRSDGSFASYVLFGRIGAHILRMSATGTSRVSNPVTVTVG
jgi:hypothetical protein